MCVGFSGKSERETARPLASAPSRCEAPHMGLAAADTKGRASRRGRVGEDECEREEHWSSGCMGLEGRGGGEEREKETRPCRMRFPTWGSLCQKGGQQRKRDGLRFPSSRYGARTRGPKRANEKPISRYGARTHDFFAWKQSPMYVVRLCRIIEVHDPWVGEEAGKLGGDCPSSTGPEA